MDLRTLGSRIREARQSNQMDVEELAQRLAISVGDLLALELGERSVRASELFLLSSVLCHPLDYFVTEQHQNSASSSKFGVRFRSLAHDRQDRELAFAFAQLCHTYLWLEHELQAPALVALHSYENQQPVSVTDAVHQGAQLAFDERERLELGANPVADVFQLVESQGVRVMLVHLDATQITGMCHRDDQSRGFALVSTTPHQNRRPIDLLHEYCHLLVDGFIGIHVTSNSDKGNSLIERRATAFATEFLLPKEGVEQFMQTRGVRPLHAQQADVLYLMNAFGASYQASIIRLAELGYLRRERADVLMKDPRGITDLQQRYRRAQRIPERDFDDPLRLRFGQLIMQAYSRDLISLGKVAELLGVDQLSARNYARLWMQDDPQMGIAAIA